MAWRCGHSVVLPIKLRVDSLWGPRTHKHSRTSLIAKGAFCRGSRARLAPVQPIPSHLMLHLAGAFFLALVV